MSGPRRVQHPTTTVAEQADINRALQECYGNDLRKLALDAGVSESTVRRLSRYRGIPFSRESIRRVVDAARRAFGPNQEPIQQSELALLEAKPFDDSFDFPDLSEFGFNGATPPASEHPPCNHQAICGNHQAIYDKAFTDAYEQARADLIARARIKLGPNLQRLLDLVLDNLSSTEFDARVLLGILPDLLNELLPGND